MSDLIFYTNPQSRGQMIRWMLEEVGARYETQLLTYGGTMKAEPYLSVNPMGKVPAIAHNGKVVTEVAAICCYLADAYPEAEMSYSGAETRDANRVTRPHQRARENAPNTNVPRTLSVCL